MISGSELEGVVYRSVVGYDAKYFPQDSLQPYSTSDTQSDLYTVLPPLPLQNRVEQIAWLDKFNNKYSGDTARRFVHHYPADLPSEISATVVYLVERYTSNLGKPPSDEDVLVVGLLQTDVDPLRKDESMFRFCELAMKTFTARPDRRFLHAFHVHNSILEMWTFDRAGAYSGEMFDIEENPHYLTHIFGRYMSMDDNEIGLNPVLQKDGHEVFLKLKGYPQASNGRISIEKVAFVKQDYLVGPGTTCFKAPGNSELAGAPDMVVKFAWSQNTTCVEKELLEFVNSRNVRGIMKLEAYEDLGDIAQLRQGLQFEQPYTFSSFHLEPENLCRDETLPGTAVSPSSPETVDDSRVEEEAAPKFENLRFDCIVTSPLGRALDTFSSIPELLTVLRDVVHALRSLYLKANILHRDISPHNIIITTGEADNSDASSGFLIDLDLALDLSNPPVERRLMGSQGFMAIGILGGDDHTYRHDLESVFYVFLWMAICHDGTTSAHVPKESRLNTWLGSDFLAAFFAKRKHMQPEEFSRLIEEECTERFLSYLPLANTMHHLLFPVRNGRMFIGTDEESESVDRLYEGMIAAFELYGGF